MNECILVLTPLAVLAVLLLFRFAGCGLDVVGTGSGPGDPPPPPVPEPTFGIPYPQEVQNDTPEGFWRLHETTGIVAKNEITGSPDAKYGKAVNPVPEGPASHHSPKADPIILQLGVTGPPPLLTPEPAAPSVRVQGGFVLLAPDARFNPPEFTLEALVLPEWNLGVSGKYYCVMESSSRLAGPANTPKVGGYAFYAGPDDPNVPNSPYHWQLWVGNGAGFVRLTEKPYKPPIPGAPANPGPVPANVPTYLAVTYSATQAFLYVYVKDRDISHVKYELNHVPFQAATNVELFIGVTDSRRALFAPFPGPTHVMYPFIGRIQEVAIYGKALHENRIGSHAHTAIEGI